MNLKTLGDGFIDNAYELFSNPDKYYADKKQSDAINTYKKTIRNNKDMLAQLTNDAQQNGITLDSAIAVEAMKEMHKN